MIIKQFDTVLLKDGRTAAVMETFENKAFLVDVGNSPEDWDTISITIDDIERCYIQHDTKLKASSACPRQNNPQKASIQCLSLAKQKVTSVT